MNKQHIADRLSQMIGKPVSVGTHSRLEDVYGFERYDDAQRQPDKEEEADVLLPDGTPAIGDDGKPLKGVKRTLTVISIPRARRKIVEQKTIDLGEQFSFTDDDGEHFIGEDEIAAAIADLEADPPPPPPIYVSYADLRAKLTDAEVEAIHKLRRTSWQVDDFLMAAASSKEGVDLRSERTAAAKALLVKGAVFNEARADEVFTA